MAARDLLSLIWSNLRRMKARVAMTAIGVVIGTAAVVVLISLAAGLQRSATEDLSAIGNLTEIRVFPGAYLSEFGGEVQGGQEGVLSARALDEFRDLPGVVAVTPREQLGGMGMLRLNRMRGGAQIMGIDPTAAGRLNFDLASGTDRLGRWQAIAGAQVAEGFHDPRTGRPVKDPPDLQGQALQIILNKVGDDGQPMERIVRVRVTGVLAETGGQDDNTLYMAIDDVLEMNGWFSGRRPTPERDGYNRALVKVASPEQVLAVEREIMQQGFYAYSARSALQQINTVFLVIQGIFGAIGAIALIVAAFGIANTMTMAIYERTREIGLMKAVGATNRDVMSIFLGEAGSIGLLGGIGGVILGVGLATLIDLIAGTYLAAQAVQSGASASDASITIVHTPSWLPVFAILFAALVGLVSGIYPAVRAASLSPIAALKYE